MIVDRMQQPLCYQYKKHIMSYIKFWSSKSLPPFILLLWWFLFQWIDKNLNILQDC